VLSNIRNFGGLNCITVTVDGVDLALPLVREITTGKRNGQRRSAGIREGKGEDWIFKPPPLPSPPCSPEKLVRLRPIAPIMPLR